MRNPRSLTERVTWRRHPYSAYAVFLTTPLLPPAVVMDGYSSARSSILTRPMLFSYQFLPFGYAPRMINIYALFTLHVVRPFGSLCFVSLLIPRRQPKEENPRNWKGRGHAVRDVSKRPG